MYGRIRTRNEEEEKMAGKKKANPAFIMDQTKTQYEGFVSDVAELVDVIKELDLDNKITGIMEQLEEKRDQIQLPEDENAPANQVGSKDAMQKNALTKLIEQLDGIRQYVRNVVEWTTGDRTSLNILMNWTGSDPSNPFVRETEQNYEHNINSLMSMVKNGLALFCGGQENGFPQNIKKNLDAFNILDEFREFTTENSVMSQVDDILTSTSKIYTKSMRIVSLGKRHKEEKKLEDVLDYEKKNLEEYGKNCATIPGFSLKTLSEKFVEAMTNKDNDKRASDEAKVAMDQALSTLERLKAERQVLVAKGPAEEEKKRKAEADYATISDLLAKIIAMKKVLEEVTFKKPLPDLKALDDATGTKYVTYKELLDESKANMDQLAIGETQTKARLKSVNEDVVYAIKNGEDTRLQGFVDAETKRFKYLNYPTFGMEIRTRLMGLPTGLRINCDTFNLKQIDAEVDRRILEKKGENTLWFAIKGMIANALLYCPNEYLVQTLSEENLLACEEKSKTISDELDKDELHQKIKTYNKLKEDAASLQKEILQLKAHDKKDKAFWTKGNKNLLKRKETELQKIQNDIDTLKKDRIYVEGSSSILPMIEESVNLTRCIFSYSVHQVDLYMDVLKKAKENKDAYNNGVYMARQEIYVKMVDIYESIPDNAIRKQGDKKSTKKDSGMKDALDHMRDAVGTQAFKDAYDEFMQYYNFIKDSFKDEEIEKARKIQADAEKIMKDTHYEERLAEYNQLIETAEADYGNKRADYETKKAASDRSIATYDISLDNLRKNGKYFDRKLAAERYDRNNLSLADAKYAIDQKGDNFFMLMRQPFNQYFARKDFSKKRRHGDSDEYKNMIIRLTNIVNLSDDASLEDYKSALSELKTFAQAYVTKREGQFFISKTNPMRKYRLKYAKDLIALCDDQISSITGNERTPEINPEVDKYLKRTEVLHVEELSEEEKENVKKAYNDSLDARRDEAISAYKKSAEVKAKEAYVETEFAKAIARADREIENLKFRISELKRIPNIEQVGQLAEQALVKEKQNREQLIKNYQMQKLQNLIANGDMSQEEKDNLQKFLDDMVSGNVDLDGKNMGLHRVEPQKQIINIIEEDQKDEEEIIEDEKEKKPNKRKKMKELREEEQRQLLIDEELDKISQGKPKKRKSIRSSIGSVDDNLENSRQSLNKSVDSIADIDRQIEDALDPKHFTNAKKNTILNEE